jgi:uncharacterized OB-fold protein
MSPGMDYQRRRAAGLCKGCGKPAAPNRTRCPECAEKDRAHHRNVYRRNRPACLRLGVCVVCSTRLAMEGRRWCAVCSERATEYQARARQKRHEGGLCPRCGGERDNPERLACSACLAKVAARTRAWRAKKKTVKQAA